VAAVEEAELEPWTSFETTTTTFGVRFEEDSLGTIVEFDDPFESVEFIDFLVSLALLLVFFLSGSVFRLFFLGFLGLPEAFVEFFLTLDSYLN
jgi:hypothetical protein